MKSIFVPIGGSDSDAAVLGAAFAVAEPTGAHLDFFHVRVAAEEAALWRPHAGFAAGPAMDQILARLRDEADARAAFAHVHVAEFCRRHSIPLRDTPVPEGGVSASWREEAGKAEHRILFRARHHDLMVLGRRTGPNGLPPDLTELLLLGSGRPLLIVPKEGPNPLLGTVVVCWKDSAEAARAVGAAMPLLVKARRVILAAVEEKGAAAAAGLGELARAMAWHGADADVELIATGHPTADALLAAARAQQAGLLVLGGYGRSRTRQAIFGGVTQTMLDSADLPLLVMH